MNEKQRVILFKYLRLGYISITAWDHKVLGLDPYQNPGDSCEGAFACKIAELLEAHLNSCQVSQN